MAISAERSNALAAGLRKAGQRRNVVEAFSRALDTVQANGREHEVLRTAAMNAPLVFIEEAIKRLRDPRLSQTQRAGNAKLFDVPEVLDLFIDAPYDTPELIEFFSTAKTVDPLLDVKLGQLLPQPDVLDPMPHERLLRMLAVLEAISPGPRLLIMLNRLSSHTDQLVAQKVALLIGQRLHNKSWIERQMKNPDDMLRANVLEALWGVESRYAMTVFLKSLHDPCSRVVGNAVVGMHLMRDATAVSRVRTMLRDERLEFRLTAMWAVAKLEAFELRPQLEQAADSDDAHTRVRALKSLEMLDLAQARIDEERRLAEEAKLKREQAVAEREAAERERESKLAFNYITSVRHG